MDNIASSNVASSVDEDELGSARPKRRLLKRTLLVIVTVLVLAIAVAAFWPASPDFQGDDSTAGVGPGHGGLERVFPAMLAPADNTMANPMFKQRAELGRLLYFDPVLSKDSSISCAVCHHPDLGFTDMRGQSMGIGGQGLGPDRTGGEVLRRGAPTIWDACYNFKQFWDGRADTLEDQALGPITTASEMGSTKEEVVAKLKAIPEYAKLFDQSFNGSGGSSVTFQNVVNAIADFERTLTANNSPFDKFVAGDLDALTPQQRRGFNLFRSGKTRCFECHGLPTFANPAFKIVGVPDIDPAHPDLGRSEIAQGEGYNRAFKVPTLRNVALTPPYMHNGRFKTLEEVITFYAHGGGPGMGFPTPNIDDKIRPYDMSAQEIDDLVAFLCSLTDESNKPQFPERVPSGLAIVPHLTDPGEALAAKYNTGSHQEQLASRLPQTLVVKQGESIQSALNQARPGDVIEVQPGIYHEELSIDVDNITMRGAVDPSLSNPSKEGAAFETGSGGDQPRWPVLDGGHTLSDAVIATGNDFRIEGFEVRHYTGNGIAVQRAHRPVFQNLSIDDTGRYGVYPVSCTGVTINHVTVTNVADAGIYVGQSRDIVVRNSDAHINVTGIEIENSLNAVVEDNYVYNNTGGILVFVLPNNPSKVGDNCKVVHNRVINNNHPNFADPQAIVHNVPPGTGIMIMAADHTEITENQIQGNNSYGIGVLALTNAFPKKTSFDVGAIPEYTWVHNNQYADNGKHVAESLVKAGVPGRDLVWDGSGWTNRWDDGQASRSSILASSAWPDFAKRVWWRTFSVLKEIL